MNDEIVVFSVFTLICSAFLMHLILSYSRRINRLRHAVGTLDTVSALAQQRVVSQPKKA
jgi:hypothetical protein